MTKPELTQAVLTAKAAKNLTWATIAQAAGLSEVYTTSACLGENALAQEPASKVAALLDLGPEAVACFAVWPNKGENAPTVPKEPLQYRLQEVIYIYGPTIKALVEEKFGAGIMSAIAFTMDIHKVPGPKGDQV